MFQYQVTALFGNIWEVVGEDTVSHVRAAYLAALYENIGRSVCIHEIYGNSSRVVYEKIKNSDSTTA